MSARAEEAGSLLASGAFCFSRTGFGSGRVGQHVPGCSPAPIRSCQILAIVNPLLGILFKVISGVAFTLMSASIKWLGTVDIRARRSYPVGEVVFFRSFLAMWTVVIWLALSRASFARRPGPATCSAMCSAASSGPAACSSASPRSPFLPLPDATALGYIAPLMTVILAAVLLHEACRHLSLGRGRIRNARHRGHALAASRHGAAHRRPRAPVLGRCADWRRRSARRSPSSRCAS